ncbi:unnamed protein product, partial [Heterosigma akashiwo]
TKYLLHEYLLIRMQHIYYTAGRVNSSVHLKRFVVLVMVVKGAPLMSCCHRPVQKKTPPVAPQSYYYCPAAAPLLQCRAHQCLPQGSLLIHGRTFSEYRCP